MLDNGTNIFIYFILIYLSDKPNKEHIIQFKLLMIIALIQLINYDRVLWQEGVLRCLREKGVSEKYIRIFNDVIKML